MRLFFLSACLFSLFARHPNAVLLAASERSSVGSRSIAGSDGVDDIRARGSLVSPPLDPAPPYSYVLSSSAKDLGLTEQIVHEEMSRGSGTWSLFSGVAPEELPDDAGQEFVSTNDPSDHCSKGDQAGFSVFNVSVPALVPFLVPGNQQGRSRTAVIVVPGGGTRYLAWSKEGTAIANWLNSIGISAFVLKYRVPSNTYETMKKPNMDLQRAVRLLRSKAAGLDLDPHRVGVMGFSSGAFLAAQVATTSEIAYDRIDTTDDLGPIPDFVVEIYGHGSSSGPVSAPPTFIAVTTNDPCVDAIDAEAYYQTLASQANGNKHELHMFADGHHGFGDCTLYMDGNSFLPVCGWTVNAQVWMENLFGDERARPNHPLTVPSAE